MSSLASLPCCAESFYQWGRLLHDKAVKSKKVEIFRLAEDKFRNSISIFNHPDSPAALWLGRCLFDMGDILINHALMKANSRAPSNDSSSAGDGNSPALLSPIVPPHNPSPTFIASHSHPPPSLSLSLQSISPLLSLFLSLYPDFSRHIPSYGVLRTSSPRVHTPCRSVRCCKKVTCGSRCTPPSRDPYSHIHVHIFGLVIQRD